MSATRELEVRVEEPTPRGGRSAFWAAGVVLPVLALLVPLVAMSSSGLYVAAQIGASVLFAESMGFVMGFAGVATFGNQLFYGAAAYSAGTLAARVHIAEIEVLVLAGAGAGVLLALVVAVGLRRDASFGFAMFTLAVGQIAYLFVSQSSVVYGANGLSGIPRPTFAGASVGGASAWFATVWVVVVVASGALLWLRRSKIGLVIRAGRDSADFVMALGIPYRRYQLLAFTVGAALCGAGGALYAAQVQFVDPSVLYWTTLSAPLFGALLGGIRTFAGPIVGAVIYGTASYFLGEVTRGWLLWLGIGVLVIFFLAPEGIIVTGQKWIRRGRDAEEAQ